MTDKISVQKISKSWSYLVQDYDEKYGGTFWLLVVSLMGYDNEVFFYVYKDKENIYIEGDYKDSKYIYADGHISFITRKKIINGYTYYKGLFRNKNVITNGKYYANCEDFKQGVKKMQLNN